MTTRHSATQLTYECRVWKQTGVEPGLQKVDLQRTITREYHVLLNSEFRLREEGTRKISHLVTPPRKFAL
jgi:hypothetical protein